MMTAEQLKGSILQLAMQGKLVEQRLEEGTGEELYKKIQIEKKRLIREGKVKKRLLSDNEKNDIPFDIPDSWRWVRISEISSVINGDRGKNYPSKSTLSHEGIPFISALNLDGRTVVKDDSLLCVSQEQYDRLGSGKLEKGDIVVCIRGSLGKHGRYPFEKGAIASSLVICRQFIKSEPMALFIMSFLDTPLFFDQIKQYDNGTAQPNLAAKSLEQFFIPLPPLAEQKRIVAKIEELMPFVEQYATASTKLNTLNATFPEMMKKSILQEVVQGKLVPQDPNDEPASLLLKKDQKKKQKNGRRKDIKKKEVKKILRNNSGEFYEIREGNEYYIQNRIPFDIPQNWEWIHLGYVCDIARGGSPRPIKNYLTEDEDGINWIKIGDSDIGGKYINNTKERIIPEGMKKSRFVQAGDFLLTNSMSFGRPYILNCDGCIHDGWLVLTGYKDVYDKDFLYYMLSSGFAFNQFCDVVSGAVVKNLNSDKVAEAVFPVPPLAEQKRIVSKIEELMLFVEELV